jgi:4'-phosphopantetheinyl transferase EntD
VGISELFAPGFVVRTGPIDPETPLHPEEAVYVERAVAKRRNEFATGRALARSALTELGFPDFVLRPDSERAPIWPEGITGSISHSSTQAIVVAGREADLGSIGVDIEDERELEPRLWRILFTPEEIAYLETAPEMGLVFFSAKEALYKAQYPRTRRFVAYREAVLRVVGPALLECSLDDLVVPARFDRSNHAVVSAVQITAPR